MSISAQWGYGHGSSVTPPPQPPCHHAACRQYSAECRHCLTVSQRRATPHVATAPHAVAALMCEPRGASGRRSRRKSPRTDKALPTRQCSHFNAPRAATNAAVYATATDRRLLLSTAGTRRHRRGAIGFARVSGNFAERWSWGARG